MRIAREALPLAAVSGLGAALLAVFVHPLAAVPAVLLLAFTLWFFRDPERTAPSDPAALISPADGRIIRAGPEVISVFMNVFNVHVCRTPVGGVVEEARHVPGRFLAAFRDAAPTLNERFTVVVADGPRRLRFTLIAGLVARRIVCRVGPGERLLPGQRIGLIQFGSRVDVELPPGAVARVRSGQRVVAGETVIARCDPRADDPAGSRV